MDVVLASPEGSKSAYMSGVPVLANFWYKAMNLAPDLVCKLKHSVLKVRSDGTSSIRCSFVLNGTKIVQLMTGQELKHIQAYANEAKYGACSVGAPRTVGAVSATVAAMAAVAPSKVRAVLRAQQNLTPIAATEAGNIMQLPADSRSASHEKSHSATLSNQLSALVGTSGAHRPGTANLSVWDELADMDSTKAAETYIRATQAVNKCTKKKRTTSAPKPPTKDYFTVVQAAENVETSVMTMKKLSESQFHIPYPRLMTMCATDENYHSLRADNDAQMGTGMAFTAHTISQPGSEETVVLTGEVDFLCSLELNFNADYKVESMVLNYIT